MRKPLCMPAIGVLLACCASVTLGAQNEHEQMNMGPGWQFMQDGVLFAGVDREGGPRGGTEFVATNWWMGMASRPVGSGRLTLSTMLSLDPLTVGKDGYRELFQSGEALHGRPLVDRQHPHDFFMQTAVVWRTPVSASTGLTIAAAPAGEPALGPVAFMHRASAADNPVVPLGHHVFDSTHVSFGVVTAAVDHGPFAVEASVFNGREPDENRWNFDLAPLDSISARVWYKPAYAWEVQVSTGHLRKPEELVPGNLERTTASVSWTRHNGAALTSVTAGYGRNDADDGSRQAAFLEASRHAGSNTIYTRLETLQLETLLLADGIVPQGAQASIRSPLAALTVGGVHDLPVFGAFQGGFGADVQFFGVPASLRDDYSAHPVSFHVFFRLRPPSSGMGRMWNMRMSNPM